MHETLYMIALDLFMLLKKKKAIIYQSAQCIPWVALSARGWCGGSRRPRAGLHHQLQENSLWFVHHRNPSKEKTFFNFRLKLQWQDGISEPVFFLHNGGGFLRAGETTLSFYGKGDLSPWDGSSRLSIFLERQCQKADGVTMGAITARETLVKATFIEFSASRLSRRDVSRSFRWIPEIELHVEEYVAAIEARGRDYGLQIHWGKVF